MNDAHQPASNLISALAFDDLGNLWAGSFRNGIDVFSHEGRRLTHLESEAAREINALTWDIATRQILAANKREADAMKLLAGLIAEQRMARKTRWTAVWIAPEIAGKRDELWQTLIASGNQDREAAAALASLSLANRDQAYEAARSLNAAKDLPSNQLKALRALMLKRAERERDALSDFAAALIPLSEPMRCWRNSAPTKTNCVGK